MEEKRTAVEMTAQELKDFAAFREMQKKQQEELLAKESRKKYRELVDEELEKAVISLKEVSGIMKQKKAEVFESFKTIIDMKTEMFDVVKDEQRTHTFTNSSGDKRMTIGVYVTDGYMDTVEEGVAIVKEYIESLANDETRALVNMVLRLLARDAKGSLKAKRIIQLRKIAEEVNNERFLQGVKIIEEAYMPAVSKRFIRIEEKTEEGSWNIIPLNVTEV